MKKAVVTILSLLLISTSFAQEVDDSDADLEELQKDYQDQKEQIGVVEDSAGKILVTKDLFEIQEAIKSGKSTIDLVSDPVLREKLVRAYEVNPMAKLPKEMVRGMLVDKVKGTPIEWVFNLAPLLLDFFVNFMHHPKAIGSSIKMFNRPDDLKTCGIFSLVLLVVLFLVRRRMLRGDPPIGKVIGVRLASVGLFTLGSFTFLWINFTEELKPMKEVLEATFS
jgi:hypothetical protein